MTAPRTLDRATRWLAGLALLVSMGLYAGTCSTGNPGTIFDPSSVNDGGNGDGDGPVLPPREAGPSAAPTDGSLLLAGKPTLTSTAPAEKATGVDPGAAIALWFSESIRPDTVNAVSLQLRPKGDAISAVPLTFELLAGDRCVVVLPSIPLTPGTTYDLVATDDLTDLEGERFKAPTNGRILRFTTDKDGVNLAPRVLGVFPPDGAGAVPNDTDVVVVFSKQMDFTGVTSAVTLQNATASTAASYDRSASASNRHAGDRVFTFPHTEDNLDLNASIELAIADTLTDAAFIPQALEASFAASFNTLGFARPATIGFDAAAFAPFTPAVNLENVDMFPVRVTLPVSVTAADTTTLLAHETGDSVLVSDSLPSGAGTVDFAMDFTAQGDPVFTAGSDITLAAYVERNGRRTTVQVLRDSEGDETNVSHDTVRPVLFSYGPPSGQFGSRFVTDLAALRPYGRASEDIAQTSVKFPPTSAAVVRESPTPAGGSTFIGPAFLSGLPVEGPLPFEVSLTDVAGNEALIASPGTVVFRGFLGADNLAASGGNLRVIAFDRDGLQLLSGVKVYVQKFGGGNAASGFTGSDGAIEFTGRTGKQTVTLVVPGYETMTMVGFDSALMSLPMTAETAVAGSVSPVVSGVNSGIVTVGGNLLVESNTASDPDLLQEVDLDNLFSPGVSQRLQRPAWFVAFHELQTFPAADRYYRFVGFDSRSLLEPSTGASLVVPSLVMAESTNQVASATDYQYPLNVTPGASLGAVSDSSASVLSAVPGLIGLATVGAGAVDLSGGGTNGAVELELSLLDAAVLEGASASDLLLQVYAQDGDGDEAVARVAATVAVSPGATAVALPDIPVVAGAWTGAAYPFTRPFTDALGGGPGLYRMTIEDDSTEGNRWQLWIAASSAGGGSLTLPNLRESSGGPIGTPPLDQSPGVSWTASLEAFTLPVGFLERSFFFTSLEQISTAWARAVEGPALAF